MAINVRPGIVTNGLIFSIDAANFKSYPKTGTVLSDLSGRGFTGSMVNGTAYSSNVGGSLSFDGVDDYVDCGNVINLLNTTTVTYNAWLKWNATGVNKTILGNEPYLTQLGLGLRQRSDGKYWVSAASNAAAVIQYTPTFDTANWHMVTMTTNGSLASLYINGSVVATAAYAGSNNTTASFNIGRITTPPPPSEYWNGNVSNLQIYNRALSATEVQQNYNAQKARFGLT